MSRVSLYIMVDMETSYCVAPCMCTNGTGWRGVTKGLKGVSVVYVANDRIIHTNRCAPPHK